MFNYFKKRKQQNALIAAARKIMADESLIENRPAMSPDALKHRLVKKYVSVKEAEKENIVTNSRLGSSPVPFGFSNHQWRELLAEMQDGDELWTFSTSDESWDNMAGRAGISLVRNGKEVS
jgi:hypothetical protein